MGHDALTTSTYPFPIVRIVCAKCARSGQYRRQTLIDRFGPDTGMPEVLEELEQCVRTHPAGADQRRDTRLCCCSVTAAAACSAAVITRISASGRARYITRLMRSAFCLSMTSWCPPPVPRFGSQTTTNML